MAMSAATESSDTNNLRGATFMVFSMAGFCFNDALIKAFAPDIGLFAAIFWRGVIASLLIGVLAARQGVLTWRPQGGDRLALVLRASGEIVGTFLFLTALLHMPLANATAIMQSLPLVVTLGAALFLGEPTGWRRYLAAVIGFCGVLLIIRPGTDGFTGYALLALVAVFAVTLRDLATRTFTAAAPTFFIAFFASIMLTIAAGIAMLFVESSLPTPGAALGLAGSALALTTGYIFGIQAMRTGEVGFVSPFRYSVLVWALLLGIFVFGERPDAFTLIGSAIIVGTGLFTFARERALRRKPPVDRHLR
ncbi:DMT family transporter [Algicella marina]|uniref:EamA family transporter n=1 Tax=Algicella marina TaxID=2683284 RepID=A0A6P1SX07_9RHOB|nr:DMT family transporter [Algicella marina]QHQ33746.1 EamA family transporter [Algicella marina]